MSPASLRLPSRLASIGCNRLACIVQEGSLIVTWCVQQVAQGMALGTGSALAHTAINSVFGSRHPDPVQVQQVSDCFCAASATV